MATEYKVVFTGRLLDGFDRDDVVSNLTAKTNLDQQRAEKLIDGDKKVVLKKGLDREAAEKFSELFQIAGMEIRLVSQDPQPQPKQFMQSPQQDSAAEHSSTSKKYSSADSAASTTAASPESGENPYAAPRAKLEIPREKLGGWLDEPRKVSAFRGIHWIKSAAAMFVNQPWKWLAMSMVAMVIIVPLNLIPILGAFLNAMLSMVLAGGLMLAARHQDQGNSIRVKYLFEGFRHNRNQLLLVGLYYLGFFVVFGLVMALFMGAGIFTFMGGGLENAEAINTMVQENMAMFFVGMLVIMALAIPVMMAVWFATPLVALSDQTAWAAYKLSFRGCLKNWLAFLVYGLGFFILAFVLVLAIGAISGLLAFFFSNGNSFIFAFFPMIISLFMWIPLAIIGGITVFTSFKDIYYQPA